MATKNVKAAERLRIERACKDDSRVSLFSKIGETSNIHSRAKLLWTLTLAPILNQYNQKISPKTRVSWKYIYESISIRINLEFSNICKDNAYIMLSTCVLSMKQQSTRLT
jgi:hypothetical protein